VVRRADVGLTTNPDATINLLAAADTAFEFVEKQKPECAAETEKWRKQRWVPLINTAGQLINEDMLDSAQTLLQAANTIFDASPIPYYYMAMVAQKRGDLAAAAGHYQGALAAASKEAAAKDSNVARIRRQSLFNSAVLMQQRADSLQGDAKKQMLATAAEGFRTYLAENPNDPNAPQAQSALARALGSAGDTAAVASIYSDMLANPAKYTDIQLFEAGTGAFRANRRQESIQLFTSGLEKNPYHRDALFNLANAYFATDQPDQMLEVTRRLVEVDPSNPDNWRLMAGAWQIKSKQVKDDKTKRALTDSILKNLAKEKDLPARVTFSTFRHEGAKHTLRGTIENRTDKQVTYSLKVEFLDAQGNVVATKTAEVGPVAPKGRQDFSVEVNQTGVVAYRYAPVT
jgi:tetratricopeptide (TPR) repeat protein